MSRREGIYNQHGKEDDVNSTCVSKRGSTQVSQGRESIMNMEWKMTSTQPMIESNGGHRLAKGSDSITNMERKMTSTLPVFQSYGRHR